MELPGKLSKTWESIQAETFLIVKLEQIAQMDLDEETRNDPACQQIYVHHD